MPKPTKDPKNIAKEFTKYYAELDLYEFSKLPQKKRDSLIFDWLHDNGYVANWENCLTCSTVIIQNFTEGMTKFNTPSTPLPKKESTPKLNIEKE